MSTKAAVQDTATASGAAAGLDALATATAMEVDDQTAAEQSDGRSSSLSDYDDVVDETNNGRSGSEPRTKVEENDSEAETLRLEATPQKASQVTSAAEDAMKAILPTSGPLDPNRPANGRKRKRSNGQGSATDEEVSEGEPARKRSYSSIDTVQAEDHEMEGDKEPVIDDAAADEELSELDGAQTSGEEARLEEQVEKVIEAEEPVLTTQSGKTKGKRKTKRQKGAQAEQEAADPLDEVGKEAEEEEPAGEQGVSAGEGEEDEAEAAAKEEEMARKKTAVESLAAIEKQFVVFRSKLYDEKVVQLQQEQELLQQPEPAHREYAAMIRVLDERRDEKLRYENILLKYKLQALDVRSRATRSQIFSQYFQDVREIREKSLAELNAKLYRTQKERRHMVEGPSYTFAFPAKRSQQILQQTAYNTEVSVLSGIAKYVGFPAAPEISGARPTELDNDLKAMRMENPPVVNNYTRQLTEREMQHPDRVAAEERFLEQTPWANPQHPVTQQLNPIGVPTFPSQQSYHPVSAHALTTPVPQRRVPMEQAYQIQPVPNAPASSVPVSLPSDASSSGFAVAGTEIAPRLKHIPSHEKIPDADLSGNDTQSGGRRAGAPEGESPPAQHSRRAGAARPEEQQKSGEKGLPFEAMPAMEFREREAETRGGVPFGPAGETENRSNNFGIAGMGGPEQARPSVSVAAGGIGR